MAGLWRVPRDWPGATCAILASGPSLSDSQIAVVRAAHAAGRCKAIAIKETWRRAPWADVLYATGAKEWRRLGDAVAFRGLKVGLAYGSPITHPGVLLVACNTEMPGLSLDPALLYCGRESKGVGAPHGGFQAINLAVLFGARRILLLGYDLRPGPSGEAHWFPDRERPGEGLPPFKGFLRAYNSLPPDLARAGVEVINCTPGSALDLFPRADIAAILREAA